jgi:YMGG-like Gly-zipper
MKRLALTLTALALCACSGRDSSTKDSTLARDLALANQAQSAQPQFQDTSTAQSMTDQPRSTSHITNPPRTRTVPRQNPAATRSGSAPAREIGAGAGFALASQQRICTTTNRPGDRFVATVTSSVVGSNGAVVPAGSSVVLDVASVSPDNSSMALRVVSVEFNGMSYPVSGHVETQSALERTKIQGDPNGDKKKVIGGAIAGAIIGQMIGHNTKGTIIGAATGAAGGAVAAKAMEKYESCLPVGGAISLTLDSPIVL